MKWVSVDADLRQALKISSSGLSALCLALMWLRSDAWVDGRFAWHPWKGHEYLKGSYAKAATTTSCPSDASATKIKRQTPKTEQHGQASIFPRPKTMMTNRYRPDGLPTKPYLSFMLSTGMAYPGPTETKFVGKSFMPHRLPDTCAPKSESSGKIPC